MDVKIQDYADDF